MWIIIISILIDQITKYFACNIETPISVIPKLLSFEYVENRGAVFGIMQGSNFILAIISLIICIAIGIYIFKMKKENQKLHIAWYMILAGGLGNLIDRFVRGYVVDFIATPFIANFNIADSLVVVGVFLLLINEVIESIRNKKNKEEEKWVLI